MKQIKGGENMNITSNLVYIHYPIYIGILMRSSS